MIRVNVVVEGQTEETFVNDVLAESLWPHDVHLNPIQIGPPGHRGGRTSYPRVKRDIVTYLKQDRTAFCSTMLDFYGLGAAFPGTPVPPGLSVSAKAEYIEQSILDDVHRTYPELRADRRLVPYIQMHEFEGLLFSDPSAFAEAIYLPSLAARLQRIRDDFETPEEINDNRETAPSKRVLALHPSYRKPLDGTRAARAVGIDKMLGECAHFAKWVQKLRALTDIV